MRDIGTKIDNTAPSTTGRLSADEFNSMRVEEERVCTSAGFTLDPAAGPDTDLEMKSKAIAKYASGGGMHGIDTGAADAYVLVASGEFLKPDCYFLGMEIRFWPQNDNTGASTVNAWGLGVKKLLDHDGDALTAGAVEEGQIVVAHYDPALDSGNGAFALAAYSNNLLVVKGAGSYDDQPTPGGGDETLPPCLTSVTGDLTNLTNCGEAIASSTYTSAYPALNAFDSGTSTHWQPTPSTPATGEWVGWDFDPGQANNYAATIDGATIRQFHNESNQTDIWLEAVVEASDDLTTWSLVASFPTLSIPGANAYGSIDSVSFTAYTARAFRIRPTSVQRHSSAALLVQVANIDNVEFTKS